VQHDVRFQYLKAAIELVDHRHDMALFHLADVQAHVDGQRRITDNASVAFIWPAVYLLGVLTPLTPIPISSEWLMPVARYAAFLYLLKGDYHQARKYYTFCAQYYRAADATSMIGQCCLHQV
jgi:hypothetical protein